MQEENSSISHAPITIIFGELGVQDIHTLSAVEVLRQGERIYRQTSQESHKTRAFGAYLIGEAYSRWKELENAIILGFSQASKDSTVAAHMQKEAIELSTTKKDPFRLVALGRGLRESAKPSSVQEAMATFLTAVGYHQLGAAGVHVAVWYADARKKLMVIINSNIDCDEVRWLAEMLGVGTRKDLVCAPIAI